MPPRKRKSPVPDHPEHPLLPSTTSSSPPPTSKRTRPSTSTTTSPTTTTAQPPTAPPPPPPPPSYKARPPSPSHTYQRQPHTCQRYRTAPPTFEKCVSCIEKQSVLGGCRFVGIRAFKVLEGGVKQEEEQGAGNREGDGHGEGEGEGGSKPSSVTDGGPKKKKKAGGGGRSTAKKPPPTPAVPVELTADWTFLGNQPEGYIPFSSPDYNDDDSSLETETKTTTTTKTTTPTPTTTLPTRPKRTTRGTNPDPSSLSASGITVPNKVTHDATPPTILSRAKYTLTLIAPTFSAQLSRELAHEDLHQHHRTPRSATVSWVLHPRPLIRIHPSPETRSLCDLCATTIFMGSYLCGCCGREYCLGCWESWDADPISVSLSSALPLAQPIPRGFPTIRACSRRRLHPRDTVIFTTRAAPGELHSLLDRVREFTTPAAITANIPPPHPLDPIPAVPAPSLGDDTPLTFLPVPQLAHDALTPPLFQSHWQHHRGVPLVVTGLRPRFTLPWDPAYFLAHHGSERCLLHNCSDSPATVLEGTVRAFFARFDHSRLDLPLSRASGSGSGSWKLKDWPPADDFAKVFPGLFRDFENALPQAAWPYATREGAANLAARFPRGWIRPDLGPKMYNAFPAPDFLEGVGGVGGQEVAVRGTTNLHLDITDAVNILVYASPDADPDPDADHESSTTTTTRTAVEPSYPRANPALTSTLPPSTAAIWDIFPPSSAPLLRQYLLSPKTSPKTTSKTPPKTSPSSNTSTPPTSPPTTDDPIHRQQHYLSEADLTTLSGGRGVRSYRIYQRPGDAVFIPAGCPHQVRNVRGAVKVAVDFLSAEAVRVCAGLVEEGRALAGVGGGAPPGVGRRGEGGEGEKGEGEGGGKGEGEGKGEGGGEDNPKVPATQPKRPPGLGKREDVLQLWNCLYFAWRAGERDIDRLEVQS